MSFCLEVVHIYVLGVSVSLSATVLSKTVLQDLNILQGCLNEGLSMTQSNQVFLLKARNLVIKVLS